MSAIVEALLSELDDAALDALADRLAPLLEKRLGGASQPDWLNAEQAAAHLACTRDRLYDLVQLQKLPVRRDGRRLLFRRGDLDAYLERG